MQAFLSQKKEMRYLNHPNAENWLEAEKPESNEVENLCNNNSFSTNHDEFK